MRYSTAQKFNYLRYIVLVIFVLLICCKPKKNEVAIIPPERFINLLMDYHLSTAIAYSTVFNNQTKNFKEFNIKDSVLKSHGYTKAVFDSTIAYYIKNSEKYEIIYDSVLTRLSRKQANIQKVISAKLEKEKKKQELEAKKKNKTANQGINKKTTDVQPLKVK